jgi:hypothetical protein
MFQTRACRRQPAYRSLIPCSGLHESLSTTASPRIGGLVVFSPVHPPTPTPLLARKHGGGGMRQRPPPPPPAPRARKCVGVSATTRHRASPTMPRRHPLPLANAWGPLRQHPPPRHPRHPPARKRFGSIMCPAASPPADTPSLSQTWGGGVYDNARRHPLRLLALANAWGYLRQCVTAPAPPRHVATTSRPQMRGCIRQRLLPPPPAPRARKRVGVSATMCHRASPTMPRRHHLPSANAGVYPTTPATPPPPCHHNPPPWSPFSLANVGGHVVCDNSRPPRCPACALAHVYLYYYLYSCVCS